MSYKMYLVVLLLATPFISVAQDDVGNWLMYFGSNRISDKYSIHSELQYRNHTIAPVNPEQLLWRVGLNHHFAPTALVTAGYAYVPSYDLDSRLGDPDKREHRIWQQLILTDLLGKVKFEHRYRIEQRWVDKLFSHRLRYRLMAFLPINKPKIENGAIFIAAYDEIFLNTKSIFFDRNRLYAALGYQLNDHIGLQLGLLRQRVQKFGKTYLQLAIAYNPDFRKKL